jgi:type I restriction enzyme S subunit
MKSNYKPIGNYIKRVENRNQDLKVNRLLGLSMTKEFRETTSNIVGTDMSVYRVMNKYQFACDFMSPIRVNKLPVVLKLDDEPNIVSPAYPVFEIKDRNELDPEYLMMWFRRTEFDRYATFKCDAAIRGGYEWNELCETLIPVPSINKQKEVVNEYNVVKNRINLNEQLIKKFEQTASAIYKQWFIDFEFPDESGKPYKSNGGILIYNQELQKEVPEGWSIKKLKNICEKIGSGSTPTGGKESYFDTGIPLIRSTNVFDYNFSYNDLAFIDQEQASKLINVEVKENDILFNITGVSVARCCMVPNNIVPARVNQHVMIIRPLYKLNILYYLQLNLCSTDSKNILLGISQSGSTREALTKSEIENFEILFPNEHVLLKFEHLMKQLFSYKNLKSLENEKLNQIKDLLLAKLATIEN